MFLDPLEERDCTNLFPEFSPCCPWGMSERQLPELGKTSKEFRKLRYFDSLFFFLGGAINSARSFVTSWLSELTQLSSEQNEEETGEGKAPEEKSEAKIDDEKNAGLQE